MECFSFNSRKNLFEEVKWLLAMTNFETTNSVFNETDEKKSFSITTASCWIPEGSEKKFI